MASRGHQNPIVLRAMLISVLVLGLSPSAAELAERVVYAVASGAAADADPHPASQPGADEHGCGATAHLCRCCASLPALGTERPLAETVVTVEEGPSPAIARWSPTLATAQPFRPPIA